jgi:hypothetical protein
MSTFHGRQQHNAGRLHREVKRDEAALRREARNGITAKQQLKCLDHRVGMDTGAVRERARLA